MHVVWDFLFTQQGCDWFNGEAAKTQNLWECFLGRLRISFMPMYPHRISVMM